VPEHATGQTSAVQVRLLCLPLVDGDDRFVDLSDDRDGWIDDRPVLPRTTRDDTDQGWGERPRDNDDRLLADRPPHWDD
jgi:hypothetical protein